MSEPQNGLYAAFQAKDARFDGRFFVGISSTGIYCRPVCRAKQPKAEHCTFFRSAAQAEQAGYRPCLLCRPEQAPGASAADATADLAYRAARMLEETCGQGQSLQDLADRLGCSGRHLRRVFAEEYSVTPVAYQQTCRLLLAKNLLTDTHLSVTEVALAAGFGSLRRFNDLFQKQYALSPTALRKQAARRVPAQGSINLTLCYRPPYQWEILLRFLEGRSIAGIDIVKSDAYYRTVCLLSEKGQPVFGWIRVGHDPSRNALTVAASESLLPVLPQVLAKVRRLFDLHCDPQVVYEALFPMNALRPGLCVPGTRLPGCFDPFEMAVRTVLGQQISVQAARTLALRIVTAYGTPVETGQQGLTHVFPSAQDLLALEGPLENHLGPLGVTGARSRTIAALARAFVDKTIDFESCAQPEAEMEKLLAIPGIGPWTAGYLAMRAMEWPDAFLETDVGVKKALTPHTPKEMLAMAEAWRPWRSYATINLWNSL